LSVYEIANAFLTTEDTIAKRIYRAKEKIKQENIKLEALSLFELPSRLDSVLHVLYLLFNEGYHSTHSDVLIREDLCEEAMRLTYLLVQRNSTNLPKVNALLSLMCLQTSRFAARTSDLGKIILLKDQDRAKWSKPLIRKGLEFLECASVGDVVSEYHVEASIASVHALASRFEDTRWSQLVALYHALSELKPGPMVSLNKAIAIGYAQSPEAGIRELQKIDTLQDHYLYLTALGNFYLLQDNTAAAKKYFERALVKNPSPQETELLKRHIGMCS
jgi:predicted RNA polymerase sigma factor